MEVDESKIERKKKNNFLLDREKMEREKLEKDNKNNELYPDLNDPNFSLKIGSKKEFSDSKIDTEIFTNIEEFKKIADNICFKDYEIAQHQKFVKNFISFQTPYNSLLLYHGLGSGKTCSAIGVSEQMRKYMTHMNLNKRIIIVASPNVQKNFKLQLFDDNKLEEKNGIFTLNNCTGDKILKEINPTNNKGLKRDQIIKMINNLISKRYVFMGYTQFSNYIEKKIEVGKTSKNKEKTIIKNIKNTFDDRLLIIDEVHNIRLSNDNKLKKISSNLFKIAKHSKNFKMLLLSATPLYNNYKEIVWLLNLMNTNDKRGLINRNEIFDDDGNFSINEEGEEIGKKRLINKATGYVSYVRGENPYSFPFRVFPMNFDINKSIKNSEFKYPSLSLNEKNLTEKIEHIDTYLTDIGEYQEMIYDNVLKSFKDDEEEIEKNDMDNFGYTMLTDPIEVLNIAYPQIVEIEDLDVKKSIGSKGLNNVFTFKEVFQGKNPYITDFEYKKDIKEKYGRVLSQEEIGKYSGKIKVICDKLKEDKGISIIYSQFIDAGVLPIALALEEMGYIRYGETKNLFNDEYRKDNKITRIDSITGKKEKDVDKTKFNPATYMMITGKQTLSSNWLEDFKIATDVSNKNGEKIKVIIITRTGSEGLDFTNIRSIHIVDPWYNMNRIEQIIGRGIRFCSHKNLKFENRNCCIYMYNSQGKNKDKETADMYIYRLAEKKSLKIGNVTRVLKETAVDCVLNISQTNFSFSNMEGLKIEQNIHTGNTITLDVGDKPYTSMCDYQESCEYKCKNIFKGEIKELEDVKDIDYSTYNEEFISSNSSLIIQKIKKMFYDKYFYTRSDIISEIKSTSNYSLDEILYALNEIVTDGSEIFVDKYNRLGKMENIGDMYMFQPIELENSQISMFDRENPVNFKHDKIKILNENVEEEGEKTKFSSDKIFLKIKNDYSKIIDYENNETNYSFALKELLEIFGFNKEKIKNILINHLIDNLSFKEKHKLIDYIYNLSEITHELEDEIKKYFEKKIISNQLLKGILLQNEGKYDVLIMKNNDDKKYFIKAKQGEINSLIKQIKEVFLFSEEHLKKNFGNKIGILVNFKNKSKEENELLFKIKDMEQERTTGARCDQFSKNDKIKLLNELISNLDGVITSYTGTNMKKIPIDTCYFIEFLFRYMNISEIGNKKWFLDAEQSVLNKLEKRIKL